jgi:hypothetical protein
MIYTAFTGPLAGEELELLPVVTTTWGMWKKMYPDTQIAVPTTGLEPYGADKQERYSNIDDYGVRGGPHPLDSRTAALRWTP